MCHSIFKQIHDDCRNNTSIDMHLGIAPPSWIANRRLSAVNNQLYSLSYKHKKRTPKQSFLNIVKLKQCDFIFRKIRDASRNNTNIDMHWV